MYASPLDGRTRVVRIPTVVDLPAPLGPSSPKISPPATSSERPSSATTFGGFAPLGFFPKPPDSAAPRTASGGGELYTFRRLRVRIPTAILFPPTGPRILAGAAGAFSSRSWIPLVVEP